MNKKTIAIDMDDTICHLIPKALHYHNQQYPQFQLAMDQITNFNLTNIWHPDCTEEAFFGRPGLYEELDIFDEYTVDEIRKMTTKYDVIVVTAARPSSVPEKWNWMQKHLPFISYDNFFVAKRKDMIDFDLLIDDGPHNIIAASKAGKQTILIPRPWNLSIQHEFQLKDSWNGMCELVDRMLEGS